MHHSSGFALVMTNDDIDQIQLWINAILTRLQAIEVSIDDVVTALG